MDDEEFCATDMSSFNWISILPRTKLTPHTQEYFTTEDGIQNYIHPVTHVRITIFPDGGISRLRVFGNIINL